MNRKAQGTLEYLIILAVVLIIAFVVANYVIKLGGTTGVNEQDSKIYWSTQADPFRIPQYSITSSGVQFVLQHNLSETVTVLDINFNDVSIGAGSLTISPGAKKTASGTGVKCTKGEVFSYKVSILYNTESLSGIPFVGQKNLVGTCAG